MYNAISRKSELPIIKTLRYISIKMLFSYTQSTDISGTISKFSLEQTFASDESRSQDNSASSIISPDNLSLRIV